MEKNINFNLNLNKQTLANFISFLPFGFGAIIFAKLAIEILYVKPEYITFLFLIAYFVSLISAEILKRIFYKRFKGTERPQGARGCDFFSIGPDVSGRRGFPSGHMSVTSACCVLIILFLAFKSESIGIRSNKIRLGLILVNIILIILMGWARHYKKCHNLLQIGGGTILGTIIAALLFFLKK